MNQNVNTKIGKYRVRPKNYKNDEHFQLLFPNTTFTFQLYL